jgi:hypothetical protein
LFEKIDDVVFDTCVLFPPTFRDVIVQLAMNGCVNLRIPTIVLYELERVLTAKGYLDDVSARRATKKLAESFLRRTDIQPMSVGDEGVLEYCLANKIGTLVTENIKDFSSSKQVRVLPLRQYLSEFDSGGLGCLSFAIKTLTSRYKNPAISEPEFRSKLAKLAGESALSALTANHATASALHSRSQVHPHQH